VRALPTLCVINWNGERYLERTLSAAMACRDELAEIILVDNASTDASLSLCRRLFPGVAILELPENRGPGTARNAAFARAGSDRVLFVDNDVEILPGAATALGRALDEHPDAVLAMSRVLHRSSPATVQFDGSASHISGLMTIEHAEMPDADVPEATREIGSIITSCFLADRTRWPGGPLFEDSLFFYLEDHHLGLRTRLLGGRILSVPSARCLHGEGTPGISRRETGRHTPLRIRHTIRNRWLILLELYELRTLVLLAPSLALFELFQLAGAVRKGWIREWLGAARGLVREAPAAIRRRRALRTARRLHDADVLAGGPVPFTAAVRGRGIDGLALGLLDRAFAVNWALASAVLPMKRRAPGSRGIRTDIALSFASQAAYKVGGLVIMVLIARSLGREAFGAFSYTVALATVGVLFTDLGATTLLLRESAVDPARAGIRLREVLRARRPLLVLFVILLEAYAALFHPDLLLPALLAAVYVGLKDVYLTLAACLLGLRRIRATIAVFGSGLVLLLALVAVATFSGGGLRAILLAHVAWSVYLVLAAGAAVRAATDAPAPPLAGASRASTLRAAIPLFAPAALGPLHLSLGTLLLGALGSYSAAAVYEVGAKALEASQFLVRPLSMVLLPFCAGLAAAGDRSRLASILPRTLLWGACLGGALALFILAAADIVVPAVFGPAYADAAPVVRRAGLAIPALHVSLLGMLFLTALRRERAIVAPLAAGVAINAILNAAWIPVAGATGSAWATVVSNTLTALWLTRLAWTAASAGAPAAPGAAPGPAVVEAPAGEASSR